MEFLYHPAPTDFFGPWMAVVVCTMLWILIYWLSIACLDKFSLALSFPGQNIHLKFFSFTVLPKSYILTNRFCVHKIDWMTYKSSVKILAEGLDSLLTSRYICLKRLNIIFRKCSESQWRGKKVFTYINKYFEWQPLRHSGFLYSIAK